MQFHSDYHDYLFSHAEIATILASAGFPLEGELNGLSDKGAAQEWMKMYAIKGALRVHEAAWILSNSEPPNSYSESKQFHWRESNPNASRNIGLLIDEVDAGEIKTRDYQWHIDSDPATWLLDHQAILAWCQRAGMEWPLESLMPKIGNEGGATHLNTALPPPADDSEIAALRHEVAELRATVEELKKSVPLHPGHLMGKAIEAQHKYWQDPEKRPKAEGIVRDLRSRHPELSEAKAKAIEAVACPIER